MSPDLFKEIVGIGVGWGLTFAGAASLFALGVGGSINFFKNMGGIR